jgi:RHS repeat-associated protein
LVSLVTSHYYLGGKQIAFKKGTTLEYVHTDHLGSTSVTTNSSGAEVSTVKYFPFGGTRISTGAVGTDKLFTGQRLDETGLYFYNARYYDATIGRFISPDTIVPSMANPQSFNRYSYCMNNPLRYTDPSGHATEDQWAAFTAAILAYRIATEVFGASHEKGLAVGIKVSKNYSAPKTPVKNEPVVVAEPAASQPKAGLTSANQGDCSGGKCSGSAGFKQILKREPQLKCCMRKATLVLQVLAVKSMRFRLMRLLQKMFT